MARSASLVWALVLVLFLGGLLSGCGRGSFVGRRFDNFTAYYNTFYNARKAFEEGLESVQSSEPEIERRRYISIFSVPESQASGESFENAVQKSADLLREHPNSKWVDDALILIGRSYYYQQNYVGAAQKFREVIALDAEKEGEARFWLARTLVATERYTDATEALAAALDGEEEYGTWTAQMYLLRGELLVRQEQWEDAEAALSQGLEGELPDDVGARGAFLLGQVRETLDDYDGARTAYRRVTDFTPRYAIEFAARLNAIEMEGLHGSPEEALRSLDGLRRGDDTEEMRSEIAVVRARLYEAQGRPDDARRVLVDMLRHDRDGSTRSTSGSSSGGATAGRGILHYELGTVYRDAYDDFTRAAAHFDTAATAMSSGSRRGEDGNERRVRTLPRSPSDAEAQSEQFGGLADRAQTVARMDSLLRLGRMEPAEFEATVQRIRRKRLREREREARERRRQEFGPQGGANRNQRQETESAAAATGTSDDGFLFYRSPTQVQQGRSQFRETWGNRPLVDNWRRQSAIQAGSASADSGADQRQPRATESPGSQTVGASLVDVSAVPRDSASQAQMEKDRAFARYELANSLFRAANRPDSAETWYRRVLEANRDSLVARQALYALAQSHMAQGDTLAARDAYRQVIEKYPGTSFADRSRQQLGLDRARPRANLTESRADSAYAQAYRLWREGPPGPALDSLFSVARGFPETSAAPKALLAAGVLYHRAMIRDSTRTDSSATDGSPTDSTTTDASGTDSVAVDTTAIDTSATLNSPSDSTAIDSSATRADSTESLVARLVRNLDVLTGTDSTAVDSSAARPDTLAETGVPTDTATVDSTLAPSATQDSVTMSGGVSPPDTVASDSAGGDENATEPRGESVPDTTNSSAEPVSQPDTTRAPTDSTVVSLTADSTAPDTAADSAAVAPDSTVRSGPASLPSRPPAEVDTTGMRDTTTVAATDSTGVDTLSVPDSVDTVPADSSGSNAETNVFEPLKRLFEYITQEYPEAPQSKRAQFLLEGLEERATPDSSTADTSGAPADSAAVSDSTGVRPAVDTTAVRDTLATEPPPSDTIATDTTARDSTSEDRTPADTTTEGRRVPTDSLPGQPDAPPPVSDSTVNRVPDRSARSDSVSMAAAADSSRRSWMLLVETLETEAKGETRRREVQERISERWSVVLLPDSTSESVQYRVVIGRFASKEEASRAKALLLGQLQSEPTVWRRPSALRN